MVRWMQPQVGYRSRTDDRQYGEESKWLAFGRGSEQYKTSREQGEQAYAKIGLRGVFIRYAVTLVMPIMRIVRVVG